MIVLYCALGLLLGYAAGFFHCWRIARTGMDEIAGQLASVGHKLAHGERTALEAPIMEAYELTPSH